jgi:hypothetical protein
MRVRRRIVARLGCAIISASITALLGSCASTRTADRPDASPTPKVVPGSCPETPFTVSRLPRLGAGSEIPAPEEVEEGESSLLVWFEDTAERREGRHVSLMRSAGALIEGSLSDFPTMSVRGQTGHLVWVGDPGVGELSIVWTEPSAGPCTWSHLTLMSQRMSEAQAEAEIQRIAASLDDARSE